MEELVVYTLLKKVYPRYTRAIDDGRKAEVAAAFIKEANML